MKEKLGIFSIILLLSLAFAPLMGANASNDNNLVQLDLKKSNNNGVDVTFFTTNPYSDNIVVRKKSDNKYVILMPKVLTAGYSSPNLNGVKDVITNIDVKSLNDAGNGYTKVTLITTKPINIKTRTQKSMPMTAEQQDVKTLIQEANTIKPNAIRKNDSAVKVAQKTLVTVNKASKTNKTKVNDAPKIKLTTINQETLENKNKKMTQVEKIKEKIQNKTNNIEEKIKNVPEVAPIVAPTAIVNNDNEIDNLKDIKELEVVKEVSFLAKLENKMKIIKNEVGKKMPINILPIINFIIAPILALIMIIALIKASLAKSRDLKKAFVDHLSQRSPILNTVKYNNIVNNEDLSWQEKYKRFLEESSRPASRSGKGHYAFITTPKPAEEIEQKRRELEKMIAEDMAPRVNENNILSESIVFSEDDSIADEIAKSIKLKGFSKVRSLKETSRKRISSRFKKYEVENPQKEQKNMNLGSSALYSNPRKSKNESLQVTDLKGGEKNKSRGKNMNSEAQDYVMSSLDEYFEILEKEYSQSSSTIKRTTNPIVASALPTKQLKPAIKPAIKTAIKTTSDVPISEPVVNQKFSTPINEQATNPISKLRNETKSDYFNGLVVKSGFNIDANRGFYMVNIDGKSTLVGRIKEEVFVLKEFGNDVERQLQVRHDNDNVYMVKTEGFKSLVEVSESKMGVLIEL